MLQIITGRFFDAAECHITDQKVILFSNYHWVRPVNSILGKFEPVNDGVPSSWIWSYQHRHPKSPGKFSVVRIGTEEVLEQFRCFAMLSLNAYFAFRQSDVEHFCRTGPSGQGDGSPPRSYIPRIFDTHISGVESEEHEFNMLLEKALRLPRAKYVAISTALRAFRNSLEALDTNVDLAYSILVYALEALSQSFDGFSPSWDLYDPAVREQLDHCLETISSEAATAVREILLKAAHVKLQARFISFCSTHVSDDYFIREAEVVPQALRRSELEHALGNAYKLRSKYVHVLEPIVHQLRHPQISQKDTFRWDGATYLTFSGLVRLARHIFRQFIIRGEILESERVNWRAELPGLLTLKMAPEYWISNPAGFSPNLAAKYLTEFMSYMLRTALQQRQMIDMLPLMEKLEADATACNSVDLAPLLCLYWAYHTLPITDGMRRPGWQNFLNERSETLDQCHIYTMATRVFVGAELEWPAHECLEGLAHYRKKGWKSVQPPIRVELAVFVAVAEKLREAGDEKAANAILQECILNAAGLPEVQKLLMESQSGSSNVDLDSVMGWPKEQ